MKKNIIGLLVVSMISLAFAGDWFGKNDSYYLRLGTSAGGLGQLSQFALGMEHELEKNQYVGFGYAKSGANATLTESTSAQSFDVSAVMDIQSFDLYRKVQTDPIQGVGAGMQTYFLKIGGRYFQIKPSSVDSSAVRDYLNAPDYEYELAPTNALGFLCSIGSDVEYDTGFIMSYGVEMTVLNAQLNRTLRAFGQELNDSTDLKTTVFDIVIGFSKKI